MSWLAGRVVHKSVVSSLWDRNDEKEGENGTEGVPHLSITSIPHGESPLRVFGGLL